ncbi:hypothetical protein SFRURICE_012706 [Spodoptera frugiperda]|nr:hypothetical protein SFRURICE_012706 [Spodoptera frugiperda]
MTSLQCINCYVRLSRRRRHALSNDGEDIVNTIRLWTYLRDITPDDHVYHECLQLASHSCSSDNMPRRHIGHQCLCCMWTIHTKNQAMQNFD